VVNLHFLLKYTLLSAIRRTLSGFNYPPPLETTAAYESPSISLSLLEFRVLEILLMLKHHNNTMFFRKKRFFLPVN